MIQKFYRDMKEQERRLFKAELREEFAKYVGEYVAPEAIALVKTGEYDAAQFFSSRNMSELHKKIIMLGIDKYGIFLQDGAVKDFGFTEEAAEIDFHLDISTEDLWANRGGNIESINLRLGKQCNVGIPALEF